jgi:hypothetical protein
MTAKCMIAPRKIDVAVGLLRSAFFFESLKPKALRCVFLSHRSLRCPPIIEKE